MALTHGPGAPAPPSEASLGPAQSRPLAQEFGGTALLIADGRTALLLVNAVRHRVIARVFGIPEDQQGLLTLVIAMMLLTGAHGRVDRLVRARPSPTLADGLFGGVSVRELICSIAGPSARDTPMLGTLLTVAVVAGTARPAVAKSIHGLRTTSHRASVGFHQRYGYLVDPGHWRQRHAQRRSSETQPATAPIGNGRRAGPETA